MHTSPPPAPPYGSLIEVARKGARLSMQRAAAFAGVSKATWIDNTRGYRKRGDRWETVEPKAETVARMAHAVGLSPERLETEGRHPAATAILREMQRPDLRSVPVPDPPPAPDPDFPEEGDDDVAALIKGDLALEAIWRLRDADGKPYPREERIRLMRAHLAGMRARARRAESETGT